MGNKFIVYYSGDDICRVKRLLDNRFYKLGEELTIGVIDGFKLIGEVVLVTVNGRDHILEPTTHKSEWGYLCNSNFKTYLYHTNDCTLMVKENGSKDGKYHVIYESAYGDCEYELLDKVEIYNKYKIEI